MGCNTEKYNNFPNQDINMANIDNLFDELVSVISKKITSQQSNIDKLISEINELKTQMTSLEAKNNEIITAPISSEIITAPISSESLTPKTLNESLKLLPSYAKTELFREIRRPVDLNELYMMVLQSQRTINELQMQVDNISSRN